MFVAGGSGTRMGAGTPKQFLDLCGIPVLQRTIYKFTEAFPEAKIITVLPAGYIDFWKELCIEKAFNVPQTIVPGGMTRFHSVRAALAKVPDGAIVAIHDGVRPLLSVELIRRMVGRMGDCHAVIPTIDVVDSLKFRDGSIPEPDRSKMVAVQTPQIFLSEELKKAYEAPYETSFTDDASVAIRADIPVVYERGEKFNIKITTPEDLELARLLIGKNLI